MISGNELREPGSAALDVEKGAAATDCRTVIINDFFARQHRIPTFYELYNKIKALPVSELQEIAKRAIKKMIWQLMEEANDVSGNDH